MKSLRRVREKGGKHGSGVLIGQSAILLSGYMGRNAPLAVLTKTCRYLSSVPPASTIRRGAADGYRASHTVGRRVENETTTSCSMSKL